LMIVAAIKIWKKHYFMMLNLIFKCSPKNVVMNLNHVVLFLLFLIQSIRGCCRIGLKGCCKISVVCEEEDPVLRIRGEDRKRCLSAVVNYRSVSSGS